ncbi:MAG: hypothetical protein IJ306_05880 [Oscillospiraceae bacterium]|nr:hypothetical protein [Oscillospiraceae bacterium]
MGSNPTISAKQNGNPKGVPFLFFGEDENPPGEYLTPRKYELAKYFWLAEAIRRSEASGNPTISAKKDDCICNRLFLIGSIRSGKGRRFQYGKSLCGAKGRRLWVLRAKKQRHFAKKVPLFGMRIISPVPNPRRRK